MPQMYSFLDDHHVKRKLYNYNAWLFDFDQHFFSIYFVTKETDKVVMFLANFHSIFQYIWNSVRHPSTQDSPD